MMKSSVRILVFFLLGISLVLTSCTSRNKESNQTWINSPQDLNQPTCVIGVPQGAAAMTVGEQVFSNAKILYYHSVVEAYAALQSRKLDAFVFDRHTLEYVVKVNRDLALLPEDIGEEHITVGLPLHHRELVKEVDQFIEQYRQDGTYREMYDRWFSANPPPMPNIPEPENPTRILKVGTEGLNEPMNYYGADGKLTGFDLEFIKRLAFYLNADVQITAMNFDGLIPAVETGRIDLLVANLNKSEERTERMLFSTDYVDSSICVMVHKDRIKPIANPIDVPADLNHKKYIIGGETGTVSLKTAQNTLPNAQFKEFSFPIDLYQALESKKIDAVVYDRPALDYAALHRNVFAVLPEEIGVSHIAIAAPFRNEKLVQRVNEFIKNYREDGTYTEMYERWILKKDPQMPLIPDPRDPTETIVIGTDCQNVPMGYMIEDGVLTGFDIELIKRLALFLNAKVEIKLITYEGLFAAAASGKIDLAIAAMDATPERRESMLFTNDYIDNPIAIMIRKEDYAVAETGLSEISRLYEKPVAVLSGSTSDRVAREFFPSSSVVHLNTLGEMVMALETGKVDGLLIDQAQARPLLKAKPTLKRLAHEFAIHDYAFQFPKQKQELCDEFSEQIRAMKRDGRLRKLDEKWFSGNEAVQTIPPQSEKAPKGTLRMATVPQMAPMSFVREGKIVGYDIEIAQIIAKQLGYRIELMPMDWSGFIEAVASGKADFGGGALCVTRERKQKVIFTEPDYRGGVIVLVRKNDPDEIVPPVGSGHRLNEISKNFAESFHRTFIRENRWKLILDGLRVTIIISACAAFFGTIMAFGVCALRRSERFFARSLGYVFIAVMQGMPILVVLMILYYVVFAQIDIDAVLVAIIGFSLNFSVYVGEMMRSALDGIPKGQYEAAAALGLKRSIAFRKIIFPQMLRRIMPVYRGEFINMLKMTSIVGYIAIQDLTKMSDIIRSRTYEAFFPLIATAVIYFAVAYLLTSALSYIEFRLNPKNRPVRKRVVL